MTDLRPSTWRTNVVRPACVRAIALGLIASATLPIGCVAPKAPPAIAAEAWAGPAVSIDSSQATHRIKVEAPSPGWQPVNDQTRQAWRSQEVYITLKEPSPLYFYPQVITNHEIGTNVPSSTPLRVYVRRVPADAKPSDETAYHLVTRTGE